MCPFTGLAEAVNKTRYLLPRMEGRHSSCGPRADARCTGEVTRELAEWLIAETGGARTSCRSSNTG